jgi:hypothetical protein
MVGMPSFPMGRVPDYYGQDAAEFVPERWLKGAGGNEGKQAAEGGGLADVFAFGEPRGMTYWEDRSRTADG